MKKLLSIILSIVMVVAVSAMAFTAFAVDSPGEPDVKDGITKITVQVNGKSTKDITYVRDEDNNRVITFTYNGDGELEGWEFPGMVEGTDYTVVSEDGNSITIEVSEDYEGEVIANALVKEKTPSEGGKKNPSKTSPKTGAAAAGIAAMGAGAAILALTKKKESDAE